MASLEPYPNSGGAGEPHADRPEVPSEDPGSAGGVPVAQQQPGYVQSQLTEDGEGRRKYLLDTAVGYGQRGWRVIQLWPVNDDGCCECKKGAKCASPGKHPIPDDWPNQGSSDPEEIAHLWTDPTTWNASAGIFEPWYPLANIGILTGKNSDLIVIDVDPRNGGEDSLDALVKDCGSAGWMAHRVQTGSDGIHVYCQYPEGIEVGNPKNLFGPGIDIKGNGGQVVAAGSISGAGPYYVLHDYDPAPLPDYIVEKLREYQKQQWGEPSSLTAPVVPNGVRSKYGLKAIWSAAEGVRRAGHGERNQALNRAAFALGQLQPDGIVDQESAWSALQQAATECGLLQEDGYGQCHATFLSGWQKGVLNPFHPDWRENSTSFPPRSWDGFGLGQRMVDHFGDKLRWSPDLEIWREYRNGVWLRGKSEIGEWYAQMMIEVLEETEGPNYDDTPDSENDAVSPREKFRSFVRKARGTQSVASAARLARRHEPIRIEESRCDSDPMLINLRNGVWDARAAERIAHEPEHLHTMQAAVAHDPKATCPRWDAFLARVQPDEEMRAYLARAKAYSLTGDTSEQVVFMNHGSGANGKSVCEDVLSRMFGTYAQAVPMETLLLKKTDGQIPNDVARMAGKRCLAARESREGKKLDEAKIKELTGGETIAARFMRAEYFDFRPTGKLWLTSNHLVHLSDDPAIWRRIHLIPWPVTIPEDERDGHLAARLFETEAAGIFNWILAGLRDYLKNGLGRPAAVAEAIDKYRKEEDTLGQFIDECLVIVDAGPNSGSTSEILYSHYKLWYTNGRPGERPMSRNAFVGKLKKRGYPHDRRRNWYGFPTLRPNIPDESVR